MNTDTDKYGSMLNVNSVILPIHWRKKKENLWWNEETLEASQYGWC